MWSFIKERQHIFATSQAFQNHFFKKGKILTNSCFISSKKVKFRVFAVSFPLATEFLSNFCAIFPKRQNSQQCQKFWFRSRLWSPPPPTFPPDRLRCPCLKPWRLQERIGGDFLQGSRPRPLHGSPFLLKWRYRIVTPCPARWSSSWPVDPWCWWWSFDV